MFICWTLLGIPSAGSNVATPALESIGGISLSRKSWNWGELKQSLRYYLFCVSLPYLNYLYVAFRNVPQSLHDTKESKWSCIHSNLHEFLWISQQKLRVQTVQCRGFCLFVWCLFFSHQNHCDKKLIFFTFKNYNFNLSMSHCSIPSGLIQFLWTLLLLIWRVSSRSSITFEEGKD